MSAYDQWQVATVLPGEWVEFGDWIFHEEDFDTHMGVLIYHRHTTSEDNGLTKVTLFMVNHANLCRQCGAKVPPGVLFIARTTAISDLGVSE